MSTEEINIRKAEISDALDLAALARAGFPGYPFLGVYNPDQIADNILSGEDRWVAENDFGLIATAVLGGDQIMREVCRVVVNPNFRGNGIGRKITQHLTREAILQNHIPWADVRSAQPSMQRSALSSGLLPITIESGKHVVYYHQNSQGELLGPSRESMVHFTKLNLSTDQLRGELNQLPNRITKELLINLMKPLRKSQPDRHLASQALESASVVKQRIHSGLIAHDLLENSDQDTDVVMCNLSGNQVLVIKPDASAFIINSSKNISLALVKLENIGIQVVTTYCDVLNSQKIESLYDQGLNPAMIRPWQSDSTISPAWQIGMRKYFNQAEKMIEPVNLDPKVEILLTDFLGNLNNI